MGEVTDNQLLLIILAILIPPVPVFLLKGCGSDVCINIILCFLGGIPGMIHAIWLIMKKDQ